MFVTENDFAACLTPAAHAAVSISPPAIAVTADSARLSIRGLCRDAVYFTKDSSICHHPFYSLSCFHEKRDTETSLFNGAAEYS